MKDDEGLQGMTDGLPDSTDKMQPQVGCSPADEALPQTNTLHQA